MGSRVVAVSQTYGIYVGQGQEATGEVNRREEEDKHTGKRAHLVGEEENDHGEDRDGCLAHIPHIIITLAIEGGLLFVHHNASLHHHTPPPPSPPPSSPSFFFGTTANCEE